MDRLLDEAQPERVNDWLWLAGSLIHGRGLFAARTIPGGMRVIEYVGERISKQESLRRCEGNNVYIFAFGDEFDLDGDIPSNPARFINHSCAPNCEAEVDEGRIWIVARREIRAGEEITFNYGYDLEDYQEHPCRCGVPECVGFMVAEELFPLVRRKEARVTSAADGRS